MSNTQQLALPHQNYRYH